MKKRFYVFEFDDGSYYMGYFSDFHSAYHFVIYRFADFQFSRIKTFSDIFDAALFYSFGGSDDE